MSLLQKLLILGVIAVFLQIAVAQEGDDGADGDDGEGGLGDFLGEVVDGAVDTFVKNPLRGVAGVVDGIGTVTSDLGDVIDPYKDTSTKKEK